MSGWTFNGTLESAFNPFDEDYLVEILEAVVAAWARMKHPKRNEHEDPITFRLAGRLANDPHFAELPYDVVPQYWLLGLNGQRLGRLDLRFKHRHSQRDYFAFESKRLHVAYPGGSCSSEYSTYAGGEGMMAFIEGQYSKRLPAGGMLGYVMDGDTDRAWVGLENRIEVRRTALKLLETSKLARSSLARAAAAMKGTQLGETEHDLGSHHLLLFHLLLPVRPRYPVLDSHPESLRD
jgi:hypothetical protein